MDAAAQAVTMAGELVMIGGILVHRFGDRPFGSGIAMAGFIVTVAGLTMWMLAHVRVV